MPSQRRIKVFGLIVFLFVLTTIYFTSAARQTRQSDFYTKTSNALQLKEEEAAKAAKAAQDAADRKLNSDDNEDVGKRLKEAEERAKAAADAKGRKLQQEVMGAGVVDDDKSDSTRTVAGRFKIKGGKDGDTPGVAKVGGGVGEKDRKGEHHEETDEEHEVEVELNAILKKSPIIIFSKTYCRFSKKAKHILLDVYNITPAPYVVELDIHPLGDGLQAALAGKTKRRTVPNILINGFSIGGGDDIEDLHVKGKLEETVRSMGGKRITEVSLADEKGEMKRETRRRKARI